MARRASVLVVFLLAPFWPEPVRGQWDTGAVQRCADNEAAAFSTGDKDCKALLEFSQEPREVLALSFSGRGDAHLLQGDSKGAIADYSQAIQLDSTNPDYFNNRGVAYLLQGDMDRARQDSNRAIELNPRSGSALLLRASISRRLGLYTAASSDLEQAIRFGVAPGQQSLAQEERAKALAGQECLAGQSKAAITACSAVIDDAMTTTSALAIAYERRGVAYGAEADHARALQDLDAALTIDASRGGALSAREVARVNLAKQQQADLVPYSWTYGSAVHGTIRVPAGFKEETQNYQEGIITYLRYPDSSYLVLQHGGMYAVPMLQDPKYVVDRSDEEQGRTTRTGSIRGTELYWREVNFKRTQRSPAETTWSDLWPPNLAYGDVAKSRVELFNRALESFKRPDYLIEK